MRLKIEDAAYIMAFLLSLHAKMLKHKSIFVFSTECEAHNQHLSGNGVQLAWKGK